MKIASLLTIFSLFILSCNHPSSGLFSKKSDHARHQEKVQHKYSKTPEGKQWLAAAAAALEQPFSIQLPYMHHGIFAADRQRAMGLSFQGKRGEQLRISLSREASRDFSIFAEIFKEDGSGPRLVFAADTSQKEFFFNIDEAATYIIRLQPELLQTGSYTFKIATGPSLDFPVSGTKARTGSFWGDSRDGGKRKHEGIDIFAPKKTPVLASADGMVSAVREGGIGGKTVWLRPAGRDISLYYAHLDEQLVYPGQAVKKGDVIGTVGNTGNAKNTPPHLHFGIYTYGGAIDPLPFVNKTIKQPATVAKKDLDQYLKLVKNHTSERGTIPANTLLIPVAINAKGYIAELPDGKLVATPANIVKPTADVAYAHKPF